MAVVASIVFVTIAVDFVVVGEVRGHRDRVAARVRDVARTVPSIVPGIGSGFASVARAAHATRAPAAASATAVAAPTPRLAPVTIATLPSRSMR